MKKSLGLTVLLLGVASMGSSCPIALQTTVVQLVNQSTLSVDVQLFYGDDQLSTKTTLELVGEEANQSVPAGGVRTISVSCEELQAVFIREASLALPGGLGPELDTDILRDGTDFNCGDTITYTFTGNLIIDFAVDESVN